MRKLFLFSVLVVIAALMTSCLEYTEPQYSPSIGGSFFYVNPVFEDDSLVSAQDTITELFYDNDNQAYKLDTIFIGDTVFFTLTFDTHTSDLVSVKIDWEKYHMDLWYFLSDSTKNVLTSESDTTSGKFCFDPGLYELSFPMYFTPLVKGGTNLKLTVTSTSYYPTSSAKFYIPVKEK